MPEQHLRAALRGFDHPHCVVAYSGGMDSCALLYSVLRYVTEYGGTVAAIHIHHGLSPQADMWVQHCQEITTRWGIPLTVEYHQVPGRNIEAAARQIRYAAFRRHLPAGGILLTAHHLDDQVESGLLALKRGAGLRGLSGILASQRCGLGLLLRPWLTLGQDDIRAYALSHELGWIDDPSNAETTFDRNFLRHCITPALQARWPEFKRTAARSMLLCEQSHALLMEIAAQDWQALGSPQALPLTALTQYSPSRFNNLLRFWLMQHGVQASYEQFQHIELTVIGAKPDAVPTIRLGAYTVKRYQHQLWCIVGDPQPCAETLVLLPPASLSLPAHLGEVQLVFSPQGELRCPLPTEQVTVRFDVPHGTLWQPLGRSGRRKMKKLYQEYGIPPWERGRIPLLFYDDELIAAGNLFHCKPHTKPATAALGATWRWIPS